LNDFDRVFQVQSNDADIAREILGPETIRGSLELLRRLCPPAGMLVSINPERLLVQVDRNLGSNFSWLDSAVRQSLQLHDWLRSSVTARINEGVAVLETDLDGTNGTVFGPPVCEVCGEAIIGPHVICTQCKTPCHKDCWAYIGACSTFGCSGKNTSPATL
jgi:hypothetical protein